MHHPVCHNNWCSWNEHTVKNKICAVFLKKFYSFLNVKLKVNACYSWVLIKPGRRFILLKETIHWDWLCFGGSSMTLTDAQYCWYRGILVVGETLVLFTKVASKANSSRFIVQIYRPPTAWRVKDQNGTCPIRCSWSPHDDQILRETGRFQGLKLCFLYLLVTKLLTRYNRITVIVIFSAFQQKYNFKHTEVTCLVLISDELVSLKKRCTSEVMNNTSVKDHTGSTSGNSEEK